MGGWSNLLLLPPTLCPAWLTQITGEEQFSTDGLQTSEFSYIIAMWCRGDFWTTFVHGPKHSQHYKCIRWNNLQNQRLSLKPSCTSIIEEIMTFCIWLHTLQSSGGASLKTTFENKKDILHYQCFKSFNRVMFLKYVLFDQIWCDVISGYSSWQHHTLQTAPGWLPSQRAQQLFSYFSPSYRHNNEHNHSFEFVSFSLMIWRDSREAFNYEGEGGCCLRPTVSVLGSRTAWQDKLKSAVELLVGDLEWQLISEIYCGVTYEASRRSLSIP